ncbi:MAG: hypothetical protein ACREAX_02310 [Candidatus Nitrosotenuis sp.]
MSDGFLTASAEYFGVSPWEIEIVYELLADRFRVEQIQLEESDPNFVSVLSLSIPLEFNEEFFKWFEYQRWDKVKFMFKEMKRRRGSNKALKIDINFIGMPGIGFTLDVQDKSWFDNALEKMDSVIELLPFHLSTVNIPHEISRVLYKFDVETRKWKMYTLFAEDKRFVLKNNVWKPVI